MGNHLLAYIGSFIIVFLGHFGVAKLTCTFRRNVKTFSNGGMKIGIGHLSSTQHVSDLFQGCFVIAHSIFDPGANVGVV